MRNGTVDSVDGEVSLIRHFAARSATILDRGGRDRLVTISGASAWRTDPIGELLHVLDLAGVAVVLYDRRGQIWHSTAPVQVLVREDAEAGAALNEARRIAVERVRRRVPGYRNTVRAATVGTPAIHHRRADRETVSTRHWMYCLVAGDLSPTSACAPAVAIVITRHSSGALTDAQLGDRYGLSPRELEVARLVADGRSTPRVAEAIGVSPHTARHHLERVFMKLGVRTRAALQALLRGAAR